MTINLRTDIAPLDGGGDGDGGDTVRTVLLLHGGGGPATVMALAKALSGPARVLAPTHPGFDGTPRPAHLDSIAALARHYLQLLEDQDLHDVVVIGSSIGGWAAAEMAAQDSSRIRGLILLNPVGIRTPDAAVRDVSGLPRAELVSLASHNAQLVMANTPPMTPQRLATLASNAIALAAYDNGNAMMDPHLRERLAGIALPALVLWGESDGIAPVAYGRAYAAAFARGRFEPVPTAGHLPHIEQPLCVQQHIERSMYGRDAPAARVVATAGGAD